MSPQSKPFDEGVPVPIATELRILLVDDVKMNRSMLKRRLKKSIVPNCEITEACTGEEALTVCSDSTFDVVIMDQYMEEAGGTMLGTDAVYASKSHKDWIQCSFL